MAVSIPITPTFIGLLPHLPHFLRPILLYYFLTFIFLLFLFSFLLKNKRKKYGNYGNYYYIGKYGNQKCGKKYGNAMAKSVAITHLLT